ncbi:MAG: TolC family protein [Chlorobi bacterium]|nr:TolC family protein [Chlorobiota bacterium]
MKTKIFSIILFLMVPLLKTGAQDTTAVWSLEKCINYAYDNNISIKRQVLNTKHQETQLNQSRMNRLPDLNAQMGYNFNFGYTWIQQEATNVDRNTQSFNTGVGSNVSLFKGLSLNNAIKRDQLNLLAAMKTTEKIKNDISLQITGYYLQILFDKELLNVAKEQLRTTELQVKRTKELVDAGKLAKGKYLEIKSQAAKEQLNVTMQENNLSISLLNLAQLLDLKDTRNFDIVTPVIGETATGLPEPPEDIYAKALDIMPQIKGYEYTLQSSEYELKMAKGGYYPNLSLNFGLGANANWLNDDPNGYNRPLWDQLESTRNYYIGASLRIPLFNKMQVRNSVKNAQLGVIDARYRLEQEKLNLRKDIQKAYADAVAAFKKYQSSYDAVESYSESFRYTQEKFNVGMVNSVDYNVAKTDYLKAQSNMLQAKYEYLLRMKILDFYRGLPLKL